MPRESASAAGHRAGEAGLGSPSIGRGGLGRWGGHERALDAHVRLGGQRLRTTSGRVVRRSTGAGMWGRPLVRRSSEGAERRIALVAAARSASPLWAWTTQWWAAGVDRREASIGRSHAADEVCAGSRHESGRAKRGEIFRLDAAFVSPAVRVGTPNASALTETQCHIVDIVGGEDGTHVVKL
jgi:hypothetical protein